jgi:RNA ligase (TIGR02306 family)
MSEFHVEVVRLGPITKHPNADTLSITMVHGGYPAIVRTGDFKEGDLAVYVPVDAIVPETPRFSFLGVHRRIKAKRLRDVFSMGLLIAADPGMVEGQNVAEALGITKWEPDNPTEGSADEPDRGAMPCYTDIEGLRRWKYALIEGEEVVITEKIHGENFRAVHDGERLWVGSRTRLKLPVENDGKWWSAARRAGVPEALAKMPNVIIFGESHGYTGGFPYGTGRQPTLRLFDAMDAKTRKYLDWDDFVRVTDELSLPRVPVLYRGPWNAELVALAEGSSTIDSSHVREGIVVKPTRERSGEQIGRTILKIHGEGFLTRKGA